MGFLSDGLEPLKEAQEELLVRLDAMLVELRTVAEILHEVRALMRTGESLGSDAPLNGRVRTLDVG